MNETITEERKMLFENIAVGDTVLLHVERKAFTFTRRGRDTFVPVTVEKVTKTQFVANGERFTRAMGTRVGSGGGYWAAVYPVGSDAAVRTGGKAVATPQEEIAAIDDAIKVARALAKLCDKLARDSAQLEKLIHQTDKVGEVKEATDKLISALNSLS